MLPAEENQEENQRLAWAAKPLPELVRLSWPITVSMLSYSVMTLADTLIVGRLGSAQLAGIGLGGIAAFAIICFSMGLLRSTKVLVSQAVGAGQPVGLSSFAGVKDGAAGRCSVWLLPVPRTLPARAQPMRERLVRTRAMHWPHRLRQVPAGWRV